MELEKHYFKKIDKIGGFSCLEVCQSEESKRKYGNPTRIGSIACRWCSNCGGYNPDEGWIQCKDLGNAIPDNLTIPTVITDNAN